MPAALQQFVIIAPLAVLLIFVILFALYGNFKFPVTRFSGCSDDRNGRERLFALATPHDV